MKRKNPAKERFLERQPITYIEDKIGELNKNTNFSFQYFDNSQTPGQDFNNWTHEQLHKLLTKIKHYSANTIEYWRNQRIGAGGLKVLEVYGDFPIRSDFFHPKHVPIDVYWARFRLESDMRLIGFIIPEKIACEKGLKTNIFYVVFLDQNHRFYLSETK